MTHPSDTTEPIPEILKNQPKTELEWMQYRLDETVKFWQYHYERRFGDREKTDDTL